MLFVLGLVALGIAISIGGRKMMFCTVTGYMGGLIVAIIFTTDGLDPGGGATNNWPQIWLLSFLAIICVGIVWEILHRRIK